MPSISVLMPVYNGMPFIKEAVESVLAQDFTDWELIISDNGSIDETQDYLNSLKDPRIRLFMQETNLGIFGNLNFLLKNANTEIAKILCADDTLLPNALRSISQFMITRPNCAVSRCWNKNDSIKFGPGGDAELEGALPSHLEPKASVLAFATFGNLVGNLSKAACRPNLVLEVGGFSQEYPYAGDYEGWARVASRYGFDLQNEELVFERRHVAQNSNLLNLNNELYQQTNRIIANFSTQIESKDLPILRRHWIIHFFSCRLSRVLRFALRGKFNIALKPIQNLPLGISIWAVFVAYPIWRLKLPPAQETTRKLFSRILELNGVSL